MIDPSLKNSPVNKDDRAILLLPVIFMEIDINDVFPRQAFSKRRCVMTFTATSEEFENTKNVESNFATGFPFLFISGDR